MDNINTENQIEKELFDNYLIGLEEKYQSKSDIIIALYNLSKILQKCCYKTDAIISNIEYDPIISYIDNNPVNAKKLQSYFQKRLNNLKSILIPSNNNYSDGDILKKIDCLYIDLSMDEYLLSLDKLKKIIQKFIDAPDRYKCDKETQINNILSPSQDDQFIKQFMLDHYNNLDQLLRIVQRQVYNIKGEANLTKHSNKFQSKLSIVKIDTYKEFIKTDKLENINIHEFQKLIFVHSELIEGHTKSSIKDYLYFILIDVEQKQIQLLTQNNAKYPLSFAKIITITEEGNNNNNIINIPQYIESKTHTVLVDDTDTTQIECYINYEKLISSFSRNITTSFPEFKLSIISTLDIDSFKTIIEGLNYKILIINNKKNILNLLNQHMISKHPIMFSYSIEDNTKTINSIIDLYYIYLKIN